EDVLQHGGHGRDGEGVAHGRLRFPSRKASSDSGRARGERTAGAAGCSARPTVARTSTRPIRTCTTSGVARDAGPTGATFAAIGVGRVAAGRIGCRGGSRTPRAGDGGGGSARAASGSAGAARRPREA